MTKNPKFILSYRIFSAVMSFAGIVTHIGFFTDYFRPQGLLTYTVQSNIFVCGVFVYLAVQTSRRMKEADMTAKYDFNPPLSLAAMVDILLTMIIFWAVLAPTNWAGLTLFSFDNLMVHLFTPLLIILDRVMFYKGSYTQVRKLWYLVVFPYLYILEAYINGHFRLVMFGEISGGSYYLYPFLNFDVLGLKVFLYVALLSVVFMAIGYVIAKKNR